MKPDVGAGEKKARLRKNREPGENVTVTIFPKLDGLIVEYARAENYKKRNVLGLFLSTAADDLTDGDPSATGKAEAAIRWTHETSDGNRKATYMLSSALDSIRTIERILKCNRDEAFNAGCLLGLWTYLPILAEDFIDLRSAISLFDQLRSSKPFRELEHLIPLIDYGIRDAPRSLSESTKPLADTIGAIFALKRDALERARTAGGYLPGFVTEELDALIGTKQEGE